MPIIVRYILGALVGFVGFKALEYIVEALNSEETEPETAVKTATKTEKKVTGILLKANQPMRNGIMFTSEELRMMASRSVYLEYDEEAEVLRYSGPAIIKR
jgi:hypothetical protein